MKTLYIDNKLTLRKLNNFLLFNDVLDKVIVFQLMCLEFGNQISDDETPATKIKIEYDLKKGLYRLANTSFKTSMTINSDLKERIERLAFENGLTVQKTIENAIQYLESGC